MCTFPMTLFQIPPFGTVAWRMFWSPWYSFASTLVLLHFLFPPLAHISGDLVTLSEGKASLCSLYLSLYILSIYKYLKGEKNT